MSRWLRRFYLISFFCSCIWSLSLGPKSFWDTFLQTRQRRARSNEACREVFEAIHPSIVIPHALPRSFQAKKRRARSYQACIESFAAIHLSIVKPHALPHTIASCVVTVRTHLHLHGSGCRDTRYSVFSTTSPQCRQQGAVTVCFVWVRVSVRVGVSSIHGEKQSNVWHPRVGSSGRCPCNRQFFFPVNFHVLSPQKDNSIPGATFNLFGMQSLWDASPLGPMYSGETM